MCGTKTSENKKYKYSYNNLMEASRKSGGQKDLVVYFWC